MVWLGLTLIVILSCFGGVLLFGAPYLPTLTYQVQVALELIDLQPGQTLLELGSGDGRVLIAAAQKGWRVTGYELNPLLVIISWLRTRRYRQLVTVRWGNFWRKNWPVTDGIFAFLLPRYMTKLSNKVMHSSNKPVRLVSFAFTVPGKQPVRTRDGVYLYEYE